MSPRGDLLRVEAHDVAVVDDRTAPAGRVPASVGFEITWRGGGGRRRLAGASPAFAGRFFRHARARGTFSAVEDGFAVGASGPMRARSAFAELGSEANGLFLAAAADCAPCRGGSR
jgi:hypothetical protein